MKIREYFKLNWKRFVVSIIVFSVLVFLYNIFSNITNDRESVFFIVVVLILPLYIIIFLIFALFGWILEKSSKNKK